MLEVKNLNKHYGNEQVLQDINFTINARESLAIIGSSGSGKSTLLNILGGLDNASSGQVIFEKQDLQQRDEKQLTQFRAHNLGFIYQFHHLLSDWNAIENVCMPLFIQNIPYKQALSQAKEMLIKVGLENKYYHFPHQLSGGQRQRVAIARALVARPKLILADEPTGNLDTTNATKVMQLLLELQQEYNTSLIIVTHDTTISSQVDKILNI
jgi:lipoprotein-releasing system ATP-binding protein